MNYKQNERILQVTEKTLVIGIDIAKELHFARCFNYRGIELGKVISFENTLVGFNHFKNWTETTMSANDFDAILIGFEPTGHYWFNFGEYCREQEMRFVMVNPFHVKRCKELDDNSQTKNDRKDPKTIAKLVIDGRFFETYMPVGIYADLRNIVKMYEHVTNCKSSIMNKITQWLDRYFPEFSTVFGSWEGKAAIITLKSFPLPSKIVEIGEEKVLETWKKEIKQGIGKKRASKLVEYASQSVGCKEGLKIAIMEMQHLLKEYELYSEQVEGIKSEMESLLKEIPWAKKILDIKGIGVVSVACILAEIGDISRFDDARQIQKYAGLNLIENSSGKHQGQTTISKRGRKFLRASLFRVILPMVSKNQEFKELHQYYTTRSGNKLKKKQSLILLCCKLIRVIFVILKKGVSYDGSKLLQDIKRPTAVA